MFKILSQCFILCLIIAAVGLILSAIKISYSGIWLTGSKFAYCIYEFSN